MATTSRIELWKVSVEMILFLKQRLLELDEWDCKTLYLACQLNTIHMIATRLEQHEGKVFLGGTLHIRVLLESVANAITGCTEDLFAQTELEKLAIRRIDRKMKPQEQRVLRDKHTPHTWRYADEAEALWNRGNSIIHADADTSFYLRADPLHAVDVKAVTLAVISLTDGIQGYLNEIGAFFTSQQEADDHSNRLKAAFAKVVAESTPRFKEVSSYEDRIYTLLNSRYNAKLDYAVQSKG